MHHLVRNQPNLAAVNQAQSLKTISIRPRILVSTWTCVLKKRTHTGGYKGTFLKIEESNDHKQIFQVTWPKNWEERTFYVPGLGLGQNRFFQVTWPRTWEEHTFHVPVPGLGQNKFFQVTWPRTWKEQTTHVPGPELGLN